MRSVLFRAFRFVGGVAMTLAGIALSAGAQQVSKLPPMHDPSHAMEATNWCLRHAARRQFVEALSDCDYAVTQEPQSSAALTNRGSVRLLAGKLDQAISDFEAALRLTPDDPNLFFNRGLALAELGERKRAIADYSEAIRLRPNFAAAFHNRGYEYELLGRRDEAMADYRKALSIDPTLGPAKQAMRRLQGDL